MAAAPLQGLPLLPRRRRREGEQQRYERFVKKHKIGNKQLLWHGSRVTNWAGILSTGLRIAPPEAPVTGYMVSGS